MRIIGLDSNRRLDDQTLWLDKVLAENTCRWVVCTFHHPVFSTGKERDNKELRAAWKPLFDKYKVDIVLQGHDHTYGRTGLETPQVLAPTVGNVPTGLTARDGKTGTVYVVSVSGPKQYDLQRHQFMKRQAQDTQLYQIIHIDGDTLKYEARTAVGDVYDAFTLKKRAGQINELVEQIPETRSASGFPPPKNRSPADRRPSVRSGDDTLPIPFSQAGLPPCGFDSLLRSLLQRRSRRPGRLSRFRRPKNSGRCPFSRGGRLPGHGRHGDLGAGDEDAAGKQPECLVRCEQ